MQEQKKMEKLYILCGLSNEAGNALRSALAEKAGELGYEAVCVSRYRKEGIRQYISEHPDIAGGDAEQLSICGGRTGRADG